MNEIYVIIAQFKKTKMFRAWRGRYKSKNLILVWHISKSDTLVLNNVCPDFGSGCFSSRSLHTFYL